MGNDFTTTTSSALDASALSYLPDAAEADALAATLPSSKLAAYLAATTGDKAAARVLATARIDTKKYQGRKYGPAVGTEQTLEFPRISSGGGIPVFAGVVMNGREEVWDWDTDANEAIVPRQVKLACLFEANSILDNTRDVALQRAADGLASQSVGGMSESYFDPARLGAGQAADGSAKLCLDAEMQLAKYRLRSGQIL
jgi:hypothetical protein